MYGWDVDMSEYTHTQYTHIAHINIFTSIHTHLQKLKLIIILLHWILKYYRKICNYKNILINSQQTCKFSYRCLTLVTTVKMEYETHERASGLLGTVSLKGNI